MTETLIRTNTVSLSPTKDVLELSADLLIGSPKPGMFLRIPLNRSTAVEVLIREVVAIAEGSVKLVLDCGEEEEMADLLLMFNFSEETLRVTDDGEA